MSKFLKRTAAFILAAAVAITGSNLTGICQRIENAYAGIGSISDPYWGKTRGYVDTAFSTADTSNTANPVTLGKEDGKYDDLLCIVRKITMSTAGTITATGKYTATNSSDESKNGACQSDVRFYYNNSWYNTKDTSVGLGVSPGSDTDSIYIPAAATVYACYVINNNSTTAGRRVTWDLSVKITHEKHEGGTATCTKRAVCKYCEEEYGELAEHTFTNSWVKTEDASCIKKESGYFVYTCTDCGFKFTKSVRDNGSLSSHSFCDYDPYSDNELINSISNFTRYKDKTCNEPEQYYQICSVCGRNGTATFKFGEASGHSYRVNSWNWSSDLSSATPLYECGNSECSYSDAGHTSIGNTVLSSITEKNKTRTYTVQTYGTGVFFHEEYSDSKEKYRVSYEITSGVDGIITGAESGYNYYSEGEQVTVKAIPTSNINDGYYKIEKWISDNDDVNGKNINPIIFSMPSEPINLKAIASEATPSGTLYAFNTSDSLTKYSGAISLTEGSSLSLSVLKPVNTTNYQWQYQSVTDRNESGEPIHYSDWMDIESDGLPNCLIGVVSLGMDNSRYRCILKNVEISSAADVNEGIQSNPYITLNVVPKSFSSISASYYTDSVSFGRSITTDNVILVAKFDNGSSEVIRHNSNIWFIDEHDYEKKYKKLAMKSLLGESTVKVWFDNGEEIGPTNTAIIKLNVVDDIAPTVRIRSKGFDENPDMKITSDRTSTYRIIAEATDNYSNDDHILYRWYNSNDELMSTTSTLILTGQNGQYYVTAEDENGNSQTSDTITVNVWDITAPSIDAIDVSPEKEWAGYRVLSISASDDNNELTYAFCGPYKDYSQAENTNPFDKNLVFSDKSSKIIETNGYYCVYAKDIAGNVSKISEKSIVLIDGDNNNGIDRTPPEIISTNRIITENSVGVNINAHDNLSGILAYAYDFDGDNYLTENEWIQDSNESHVFSIEDDSKRDSAGRLFAVKDNAGNVTKTTLYVYSHKGPFKDNEESSKWVNDNLVNLCYNVPSNSSGGKRIWLADGEEVKIGFSLESINAENDIISSMYKKYIWSNENGKESEKTETTVYENGTYFVELFGNTGSDEKGNAAKELWGRLTFDVNNFDKEAPNVILTESPFDTSENKHRSCNVIIETEDEESGIASIWISGGKYKTKTLLKEYHSSAPINYGSEVTESEISIELTLNGDYEIFAVDSVGNEHKSCIHIEDIDVIDDNSVALNYGEKHKITILQTEGMVGTSSLQSAVPGTQIYLNFDADEGYALDYWESAEVEIYDNSFVMPSCDVTIQPFTKQIDDNLTYEVSLDCDSHGEVSTLFSDRFMPGMTVYLSYTPMFGYELDEIIGNVDISNDSFIMPSHPVELKCRFKRKIESYDGNLVSLPESGNYPAINVDLDDDGIPDLNIDTDGDGQADTNLSLTNDNSISHNIAVPISVSSNSISKGRDSDGQIAFYKNDDFDHNAPYVFPIYNSKDSNDYLHDNPTDFVNGATILNWDSDHDQWPDTNIDMDGDGVVDIYDSNEFINEISLESNVPGCQIGVVGSAKKKTGEKVRLKTYVCKGYEFEEWQNNKSIEINDNCFIMPASSIKIRGCFTEVSSNSNNYYYVNIKSDRNGVCATSGSVKYKAGDKVVLNAAPYPGYEFKKWSSDEVTVENNSFIMPAEDITVTGHFNRDFSRQVSVTDNETSMTRENVTLTVNLPEGVEGQLDDNPFSWDGGESYIADRSYTVKDNGVYVLTVKLADGSTFKCNPVCIDRIDRFAPSLVSYAYTNNIVIYAQDNMSGIGAVKIETPEGAELRLLKSKNTNEYYDSEYTFNDGLKDDGTFEYILKTDTVGEYRILAADRLGNEIKSSLFVDTIPKGEGKNEDKLRRLHIFAEQSNCADYTQNNSGQQLSEYALVTMKKTSYRYTGKSISPKISVKYRYRQFNNDGSLGKYKILKLKENVDYTVSYKNNIDAGTAAIILTGSGDFEGQIIKEFTIKPKAISSLKCDKLPNFEYTGDSLSSEIIYNIHLRDKGVIVKKSEYIVDFDKEPIGKPGDIDIINISIKPAENSNYSGEYKKKIRAKIVSSDSGITSISGADLTISGANEFTYTGREIKPRIEVRIRNKKLSASDYILDYVDNINCGTASVCAIGRGRYSGKTKIVTFKITPTNMENVKIDNLSRIAFRDTITDIKPKVYYKGIQLSEGKDFYYEYDDISEINLFGLRIKKARIRINSFSENFVGSKVAAIAVKPRNIASRLTTRIVVTDGVLRDEYDSPQPNVEVYYNGEELQQGTDYTVKYTGSITVDKPGKAIISGIGNYSGKRTIKFNIHKKLEQ